MEQRNQTAFRTLLTASDTGWTATLEIWTSGQSRDTRLKQPLLPLLFYRLYVILNILTK